MSALITSPAWSDGVLYVAALPVVLLVLALLDELAVRVLARIDQRREARAFRERFPATVVVLPKRGARR